MKRFAALSLLIVGLVASLAWAEVKSGLQVGDSCGAFNVKDITGPNKGTSLCYRCKYGTRPVITIFTCEVNDELAKLVKEVDGVVGKNSDQKMAAFVVVLAEDADKVAPKLEALAKKEGIKNVPLTIFDGEAGPEDYKIAKDASVTVMMWTKSEVKVNHALEKGGLNDSTIKEIIADSSKILK